MLAQPDERRSVLTSRPRRRPPGPLFVGGPEGSTRRSGAGLVAAAALPYLLLTGRSCTCRHAAQNLRYQAPTAGPRPAPQAQRKAEQSSKRVYVESGPTPVVGDQHVP